MEATAEATTAIGSLREDLGLVAQNIVGLKLSKKQREILRAISKPKARVAVRTGHGVGKTYGAAAAVLSFLPLYPGSRIITTAPTFPQVRDLLWAEINKLHRDSKTPLGGKPNVTRWELDKDWFAVGLSTDESDRIQGRHAPHVLVIFDEASGVRPDIWTAGEALMAGSDARWLAIGNPLNPRGDFAKCFTNRRWVKMHCSSLDAPNVTGEMHVPGGVDQEWINDMREKWGEDSPIYRARVLGEFPEDEEDAIIPFSWVASSIDLPRASGYLPAPVLGVDVARYGKDRTAYVVRAGRELLAVETEHHKPTTHIVGRVVNLAKKYKIAARDICVDDTGVGGGVTDGLREKLDGRVTAVNFGEKATEPERFGNRVAELYWLMREALDTAQPAEARLRLSDDDIGRELSRLYRLDSKGRIVLESKDDFKSRIGFSPDKADALALTFARSSRGGERAGMADLDLATHVAREEKWRGRRDPDREELRGDADEMFVGGDFGELGDMSGFD